MDKRGKGVQSLRAFASEVSESGAELTSSIDLIIA